ncbi:hypothetical protein [Haliovirga abyssi]|nr:hypothetical protein [Haliovirga abyssi]
MNLKTNKLQLFIFIYFIFSISILAESKFFIEGVSGNPKFDFEKEEFWADNGIQVKYKDMKIQAMRIKKIKNKNILLAYDKVIFVQGKNKVEADSLEVNLDTKVAKIINGKSFMDKVYYGGKDFEAHFPDKAFVKDSYFTTCNLKNPHYHLEAKKIIFYPGRKIVAYNAAIYIGKVPVMWLPYYVSSLKKGTKRASLFPRIGSSDDKGKYIIWGIDYELNKKYLSGFVDMELSEKKGWAVEWSNDYEIQKNNSGNLHLKRFLIPKKGMEKEWDFIWTHKAVTNDNPKKFFKKGNWDIFYENKSTNLLRDNKGNEINYTKKTSSMKKYQIKSAQKFGKDMNLTLDVMYTDAQILKDIINQNQNNNPNTGDEVKVEIYKRGTFSKNNSIYKLSLNYDNTKDLNPGKKGDKYSFKDNYSTNLNIKKQKITVGYSYKNQDNWKESSYDPNVTVIDYDLNKNETYKLKLGNYYILKTKFFYGLDFHRKDSEEHQIKYLDEKNKILDPTPSKNNKKENSKGGGFSFGNSSLPLFLLGSKGNFLYHQSRNWYVTKEMLMTHENKLTIDTPLYNNLKERDRNFDLKIKNSIPLVYVFSVGEVPVTMMFPDTRKEYGNILTLTLGNIVSNYTYGVKESFDGKDNWKKTDSTSNFFQTKIDKDYINLKFDKNNSYDDSAFITKKGNSLGLTFVSGDNKIEYSNSNTKNFNKKLGQELELSLNNNFKIKYTTKNIGLSYQILKNKARKEIESKDSAGNSVKTGKYKISSETIKKDYSLLFNFKGEKFDKYLKITYNDGEDNSKKESEKLDDSNLTAKLTFTEAKKKDDKAKKQQKIKEVKDETTNSEFTLFPEEEQKIDDILTEDEKIKDLFTLTGIGDETKKDDKENNKKSYSLTLSAVSDRNYYKKKADYLKSLKTFSVTTDFAYGSLLTLGYKYNWTRTAGGLDYSAKTQAQSIKFRLGPKDYEWWIGYSREYNDLKNQLTKVSYTLDHKIHCTEFKLGYDETWNDSKNKFDTVISLKFWILAFPDKNLEYKKEANKKGFGFGI